MFFQCYCGQGPSSSTVRPGPRQGLGWRRPKSLDKEKLFKKESEAKTKAEITSYQIESEKKTKIPSPVKKSHAT